MDTETGELVAISEWVLQWRHVGRKLGHDDKEECAKEASKYLKQVSKKVSSLFEMFVGDSLNRN
jgi:hypothetical protein